MSGQNLRNVPVRRNIGSSSTCHAVTESYEHHQSDVSGATEPKDTGRGGKRVGKEISRCTQGVLWWEFIALYRKSFYIMHRGKASRMFESFCHSHDVQHTASHLAVDLGSSFSRHGHSFNGYTSTQSSFYNAHQPTLNALSSLVVSLSLPLSLLPTIDLLLQHNTVHTRLQQRAHQTRLPLQHS